MQFKLALSFWLVLLSWGTRWVVFASDNSATQGVPEGELKYKHRRKCIVSAWTSSLPDYLNWLKAVNSIHLVQPVG